MTGLDRDAGYQFVIYGEHTPEGVDPATSLFTGGLNGRKITAFSQEVFVPMDAVGVSVFVLRHVLTCFKRVFERRQTFFSQLA